jgi:HD-GYP domain-containing protein (c-di-GMP phosphodiesterase class II)
MSDRGVPGTMRYLPHVIVGTAIVAVVPILVVWMFRVHGVIGSAWVGVPIAVLLSLLAAVIGNALWTRHRSSTDLMFSELLLWGWLRRLYVDHKIARARRLLSGPRPGERPRGELTVRQRTQLLGQLAVALEAQDPYLEGHSRRVARHATMIARRIGLGGEEVGRIRVAAVLHDVGKLCVPQGILNKPGRLTPAEFDEVKRHADEGAAMVACVNDAELTAIVRHHHERLDGSGYPAGLRGAQIPLGARIVAVADTYDAIAAARPYRPAATHEHAFDTLRDESEAHLDPMLVRAFRSCYAGKRPLVLWESLAAGIQAVSFLPRSRGGVQPHLALRDVVGSTVTTAALVAVVAAPPIGARQPEHRPAPALLPVATPNALRSGVPPARAPHPVPGHPSGSVRAVVHATAPAHRRPARGGQTRSRARGVARGIAHAPVSSVNIGSTAVNIGSIEPTKAPPTTTRPRPPAAPPRTTGRSPPTTAVATRPAPVAPPDLPAATTTTASGAPAVAPAPTPTTSASAPPMTKDECKKDGYTNQGFPNQGQCVASAEHHG